MRHTKRIVALGIIGILALGVAPATAASNAGGKISPNYIPCCRA